MRTGWSYRVGSAAGVAALAMVAAFVANRPLLQSAFTTYVPLFWRLEPVVLSGERLGATLVIAAAVFVGCFVPLFKPRPRRVLDTVALTHKRVVVAGCVLATLGFFEWSYRLPRTTLVLTCGVLAVALPAWFVAIRWRPAGESDRVVIVGDDTRAMETVLEATDRPVLGYVSPLQRAIVRADEASRVRMADGGTQVATEADGDAGAVGGQRLQELDCLGGLSRLDDVLVERDVDAALLAFASPNRAEFFGALDACYDHGVTAKVHREHADSVLTSGFGSDELVDVDLEPWDTIDHMVKRAFDVAFSGVGLLLAAPLVVCIAAAIKLDDGGPVLYSQERTAVFGDTFQVYKFRSMVADAESISGAKISEEDDGGVDPRVTRVGRFIRQTHLDEIPQLWSVLVGEMSVVGPRPERPSLEPEMETGIGEWRRRWFVKPGLTGLAQIHGVTGHDPEEKLRLDVEYIKRQSFWFDSKIVVRQVWLVIVDIVRAVRGG